MSDDEVDGEIPSQAAGADVLALAAARWRTLTDSLRDAIIAIDPSGRVTFFNRSAESMFGYASDEVVGRDVSMLMPEPHRSAHGRYIDNYHQTGVPKAIGTIRHLQARRKDGTLFAIEMAVGKCLVEEDVTYTAVIRDVESVERRYRRLVQTAGAVIVALGPDRDVTEFNAEAERVFGRTRNDVRGSDYLDLVAEGTHDDVAALIARCYAGETVRDVEGRIQHVDGTWRTLLWNATAMPSVDGEVAGLLAVAQDITVRVRAEGDLKRVQQALQALHGISAAPHTRLEDRLRLLLEVGCEHLRLDTGLLARVDDDDYRIEAAVGGDGLDLDVGAVFSLDGTWCAEVVRTREEHHFPDGHSSQAAHPAYEAFPVGAYVGLPVVIGDAVWGTLSFTSRDERPSPFSLADLEIGQLMAQWASNELWRDAAEAQLRSQQTLAQLGEMAAVIAHEVKNPLAGITGALQVIASRLPEAAGDRRVIGQINDRVAGLVQSLESLLNYARPQQLHLQVIDLQLVITETVSLFRRDARFAEVTIATGGSSAKARVDTQQLSAALLNLLINAGQALEGSGSIRVECRERVSGCELSVTDDGPGMTSAVRAEVFRPFFTTKVRGTGLGLARVKQVIDGHGGTINVDCPKSGGTRVLIKLPPAA